MDFGGLTGILPWLFIVLGGGYFLLQGKFDVSAKIREALQGKENKDSMEEMKMVQEEKSKVVVKVKDLHNKSAEIQDEIKAVAVDAAKKIDALAKSDSVSTVDKEADDGWTDL